MNLETAAIIIGLVQCLKKAGVGSKWLPLLAVLFGVLLTATPFIYSPLSILFSSAVEGAIVGLTATGMIGVVDDRLKKMSE